MRILKPEIVEPSAWQPTDALTHILANKGIAAEGTRGKGRQTTTKSVRNNRQRGRERERKKTNQGE